MHFSKNLIITVTAEESDNLCVFEPTDTLNGIIAQTSVNVRPPWGLAPNDSVIERKTGKKRHEPT